MDFAEVFKLVRLAVLVVFCTIIVPSQVLADESLRKPRTAFDNFPNRLSNPTDSFFNRKHKIVDIGAGQKVEKVKSISAEASVNPVKISTTPKSLAPKHKTKLSDKEVLGNVDSSAPKEFKSLVLSLRRGDLAGAEQAADLFVDYMVNLMWEVKEITKLIGGALLRRGLIKEENWNGVEQYMDFEMANARKSMGNPIKATHKESLKRVEPDPEHKAEIYYFFTLSCTYCRYMAADVERLYRAVAKTDPKVKMVGLTLRNTPKDWVKSYRRHTGLTIPMFEGVHVADSLDVAFVPTLVVVAPTTQKAYRRSGQMTFQHMYEFVRTVQGLPTQMTPLAKKLKKISISVPEQYKGRTLAEVKTKRAKQRKKTRSSTSGIRDRLNRLKQKRQKG